MPRSKKAKTKSTDTQNGNGANLGFEQTLWAAADKMRGHMDAAEYKHVTLGLIFVNAPLMTLRVHERLPNPIAERG